MISSTSNNDPPSLFTYNGFEDSIANICWYPSEPSPLLAVSSWDSKIRIYKPPQPTLMTLEEKHSIPTEYPCISLSWMSSQESLLVGSIDGTIQSIYFTENVSALRSIGKHLDAVKGLFYLPEDGLVCSVSYDETLKLWDIRQDNFTEVHSINLGAKATSCEMNYPYMIIGLNNQNFYAFKVPDMIQTQNVGVQWPTCRIAHTGIRLSCASISKEGVIALASENGKSMYASLESSPFGMSLAESSVNFRAHQVRIPGNSHGQPQYITYPINAIGMHPKNRQTYFTAGRDSIINFWNIREKRKQASFYCGGEPVTEAKWSPDGQFLAYGCGYDWSIGIEGAKSFKAKLCVHSVQNNELAPESV